MEPFSLPCPAGLAPFPSPCPMELGNAGSSRGPCHPLGQPHWAPPVSQAQPPQGTGPGASPGWGRQGEPPQPTLDPFSEAFPNRPFRRQPQPPWAPGTQSCSFPQLQVQGLTQQHGYPGGTFLQPALHYGCQEVPTHCLRQQTHPWQAQQGPPVLGTYQGLEPMGFPGLQALSANVSEMPIDLLSPPGALLSDWHPDTQNLSSGYQDGERHFRGLDSLSGSSNLWPGTTEPGSEVCGAGQGLWRGGVCSTPQVLPTPFSSSYRGAPYRSWLQHVGAQGGCRDSGPLHYTPAPMLNPLRRGTGLFAGLLLPSLSQGDLVCSPDTTQPKAARPCWLETPQINLGPTFQPELPALRDPDLARLDPPGAELAWRPWPNLAEDPGAQQRVENLLNLACSSALPRGG
uniref:ELM2 domain-containing protein n=1 Tax=Sphenodon punctatus TaxID=8508 RepID=A0A8D0GSI6_SPHPU